MPRFFLYLSYSYHLGGIVSTFDPIQFVGGTQKKFRDDVKRFYFHSKFFHPERQFYLQRGGALGI